MNHLSREELRRWWDEGAPGDRERIVSHLAICDDCVVVYGQVIDERPVAAPTAPPQPDLVTAGYAAYSRAAPARARQVPWRAPWVAVLATAAGIVLAVLLYPMLRPPAPLVPPIDEPVRSTVIQPVSPVGTVSRSFAFEWASPVDAASYELVVYDRRGIMLWSARVETSRFDAPAMLLERIKPGEEHAWQVTAIDRRGERTLQSPRQPFLVAPAVLSDR